MDDENTQCQNRSPDVCLAGHARDDSPDQVPTQFSGELFFDNGVSASFYNSFETEHQQWVNISGSKGHLTINDFVLPLFWQ